MGPPKLCWIHRFFTHPNGLDRCMEGETFFFNIKSLSLWATGEGVGGIRLTPNLIYGPIQDASFLPPSPIISEALGGPH